MDRFCWIMSYGGPLICVESRLASLWGGNSRLTVWKENAASDYERPGFEPSLLQSVPLQEGFALIIKEGVHDTSFWRRSKDDKLFIAQIICCEEGVDVESIIRNLSDEIFMIPDEVLRFNFSSESIEIFDSAEEGDDVGKKSVCTSIEPGKYKIVSKMYDPDEQSSLIVHMFERVR